MNPGNLDLLFKHRLHALRISLADKLLVLSSQSSKRALERGRQKTERLTIPQILESSILVIRNCSSASFICIVPLLLIRSSVFFFYLEILISASPISQPDIAPIPGSFHGHYRP